MLDPRTLWLLTAEDRYEAGEAMRRAEREVYPLLPGGGASGRAPASARWVTLVDLNGARVVVRARLIQYVAQCYAENRAAYRAFNRAHGREQEADRDWDGE